MSSSADILSSKTDAELRFFVENPHHYQPELVRAARRELERRVAGQALARPAGPAPAPTLPAIPAPAAPAPTPAGPDLAATLARLSDYVPATGAPLEPPPPLYQPGSYPTEPAERKSALPVVVLVLALLVGGLGAFWWRSAAQQQQQAAAASEAAKLSPDSLKLEEVPISVLPTADADGEISKQLAIVPAAERQQATTQQMQQYRGVSRRFWQAERPTEFVINLATSTTPPAYGVLADHISQLEAQWHTSGNALIYTYKFPPTMADQVARMRSVASLERRILEHLKGQAASHTPLHLTDDDQRDYTTAQELLHGTQHRLGTIEAR